MAPGIRSIEDRVGRPEKNLEDEKLRLVRILIDSLPAETRAALAQELTQQMCPKAGALFLRIHCYVFNFPFICCGLPRNESVYVVVDTEHEQKSMAGSFTRKEFFELLGFPLRGGVALVCDRQNARQVLWLSAPHFHSHQRQPLKKISASERRR